jgi:hypothetical protein
LSGGQYYNDIPHALGNMYPIVMLYDEGTTQSETITASAINSNQTRIYRNTNSRSVVTLIG